MCGITGFMDIKGRIADPEMALSQMSRTLVHRGPDDHGIWFDRDSGVGLGHRRLSVIDPSPDGHQPMLSGSQRHLMIYDGEVYNFRELRSELEKLGAKFRGHSDAEVVLEAVEHWGLDVALSRFEGMFAFALWDRKDRTLSLVRDRLGIKPLYYGWVDGAFVFGSELKAIRAFPGFQNPIDREALALFLKHSYIPAPLSIYRHMYKLMPGHIAGLPWPGKPDDLLMRAFWSAQSVVQNGITQPFSGSAGEAIDRLEELLKTAVGTRMVGDAPLGAMLSGGIDSSTVAALMQAQSVRPVRTFTAGFNETEFNEASQAGKVARYLGTDHTELYISPVEAMEVIPRLPILYDEPFADNSQIPTFLISRMARRYVTVINTGDGGDHIFAGLNRHLWMPGIWRKTKWVPSVLRNGLVRGMSAVSFDAWESFFQKMSPLLPPNMRFRNPAYKMNKLLEVLKADSPEMMYHILTSIWQDIHKVIPGVKESSGAISGPSRNVKTSDLIDRVMFLDMVGNLPDGVLAKLDRAGMSVSLGGRMPLLDHRVVEFAWRLPQPLKVRNGVSKWILRQVLYRYIPRELVERPKMGFELPIDRWLRGPLRDWAETLLDGHRLREGGFFYPAPIRKKWHEHQQGRHHWHKGIWNVLVFQAWQENQKHGAMECWNNGMLE